MFQTKIRKARFVLGPFSAEQMASIGQVMADTIIARIKSGKNAADASSKALKPGYAKLKMKHGRAPIRDWYKRGLTLGSLKVKTANENRVVVGFVNSQADMIAHINNRRERDFGVSPNDRKALNAVVLTTVKQYKVIQFKQAA